MSMGTGTRARRANVDGWEMMLWYWEWMVYIGGAESVWHMLTTRLDKKSRNDGGVFYA